VFDGGGSSNLGGGCRVGWFLIEMVKGIYNGFGPRR